PSLSAPAASAASAAAAAPERDATSAVARAVSEETTPGSPPVYPRPASASLTNEAPSVPSSAGPPSARLSPAGLSPAGAPPAGPSATARPRQWRILAIVTGLVVVIAAVGGWLIGHNSNHGTNSTSGTTTSNSPAPTQQASAPAPPAPGSWAMGRDSPFRVQQLEAAVLDNRIWLAGGLLGPDQATNKTEYYDPTLRTWGTGPNLPFLVHHAALVN